MTPAIQVPARQSTQTQPLNISQQSIRYLWKRMRKTEDAVWCKPLKICGMNVKYLQRLVEVRNDLASHLELPQASRHLLHARHLMPLRQKPKSVLLRRALSQLASRHSRTVTPAAVALCMVKFFQNTRSSTNRLRYDLTISDMPIIVRETVEAQKTRIGTFTPAHTVLVYPDMNRHHTSLGSTKITSC